MKRLTNIPANYLDILYANKNKAYGSYELRMNYSNRLVKSLFIMLGFVCSLCFYSFVTIPVIKTLPPKVNPKFDTTKVVITKIPDKIKKIKQPIIKTNPIKSLGNPVTTKSLPKAPTIAIVPDHTPSSPIKPLQGNPVISNPIVPTGGGAIAGIGTLPNNMGGATGGSTSTGTVTSGANNGTGKTDVKTAAGVDEVPTYPGGPAAIKAFLQQNLEYPEEARNANAEATITVYFVVMEDGSIQQISTKENDTYGFAKEGKRVVNKMPHWKPGKIAGQPVKCYFSVDINYVQENND